MQKTELHYKLVKKVKDEKFDEDRIDQYRLLVHVGNRDLQTCVVDSADHRVLLLEDFVLPSIGSQEEWLEVLDTLFDNHALLKANFWKSVSISVKNPKFALVPSTLFDESALDDYIRVNAHIDRENDELLFSKSRISEIVTVFALNRQLHQWLGGIYPNIKPRFHHQAAALIEATLRYAHGRTDEPLYIYVDRFKLHIMFCRGGRLVFYNQFVITQFADYIKYIMLVMRSLDIDQKKSQVVLWGYIGKNSPHYHEFYRYISNVAFGQRPPHLQFGYLFDEVQEHHFFDLFGIYYLS